MIKTFAAGVILGIAVVFAALYLIPAVDQHREVSIIKVTPNGGNAETFVVNMPTDRILQGGQAAAALPRGLDWPDNAGLESTTAELFKLRNARNAVIGVASRLAARDDRAGDIIEWVLHLPSRGSMYVSLRPDSDDEARAGDIRGGTREFAGMVGQLSERWVEDESEQAEAGAGQIQLVALFVSRDSGRIQDGVE